MFYIADSKYIFIFFLCHACQPKAHRLDVANPDLTLASTILLYNEKPYSGTLFSKIDTLISYEANYVKGKKHGQEKKFFYTGNLAELRSYTHGKKSGIHRTWWGTKQLKSEFHFDNTGNYIGIQREWYRNGQLSKEFHYNSDGKQEGAQKSWSITGKVRENYVVIYGKNYGLMRSKSCKSATDLH